MGSLRSPSLKAEYLHKLFGKLLHGRFFSSPYWFIQSFLCQYELMAIYFTLQVTIQCCPIWLHKPFQCWPLEALPVGLCVPSTHAHQFRSFCLFLSMSSLSSTMRCFRPTHFSCSSPRTNRFFKEPRHLLLKSGFSKKDLGVGWRACILCNFFFIIISNLQESCNKALCFVPFSVSFDLFLSVYNFSKPFGTSWLSTSKHFSVYLLKRMRMFSYITTKSYWFLKI